MKKFVYLTAIIGIILIAACTTKVKEIKVTYPDTKKGDVVDNYFGVEVADPYRWLENDTSQETAEWVEAENEVTYGYLGKIEFREEIKERFTELWNYPKYGVPFKEGGKYFFSRNDGLQNQSVLYIQERLDAEPEVLLDPNELSEDGTIALATSAVSKDGKYLAYATAEGGSDWNKIYVMEIDSRKKLDDEILWVKFSGISWKGEGFYYSRFNEPEQGLELSSKNEFHKVYYHKVGTPQSEDVLIHENRDNAQRNYYAATTDDENFLILYESESTDGNALYYKNLTTPGNEFIKLADGFEYQYGVIDNIGNAFLVMTNDGAPKKKLVMINLNKAEKKSWKTLIPEKEEVLKGATLIGNHIVTEYMKDASSKAFIYNLRGKYVDELALPGIGSLYGFSGKKDENIAFYLFTSFIFPSTIYKYDISSNRSEIYKESDIDFNPDDYVTNQVFYESKDGTKIPMFLVHHKDLKLNGKNPTYLYGYGGFNISLTPYFSVSRLIFLENGGLFALANLRGGGEYGEEWHKAGIKLQKQNVFDDFIAAAEYLIDQGYTNPDKLAIAGGSNGGLLVGACIAQRPELFKVAMPAVGVMDMLRYHEFTIGWAWAGDYGTSDDDSTMFNYLHSYSPLHNLTDGVQYPATFITTADHDDRVVPAHSFKFAATIQEKHVGANPVLIRIETKAGHGAGKPTSKIIEEVADEWGFIFYNLGMEPEY
ncbi:MAG: S9 family peptidase [Bacteroidales bacterium]|nr:S9 family peptidase [Bacteroidales bacterium]